MELEKSIDAKLKEREVACAREGDILVTLYDNDLLVVYGKEPAVEEEDIPSAILNLRDFECIYNSGDGYGHIEHIPSLSYEPIHPYNKLFGPHKPQLLNEAVRILAKEGIELPDNPKGYPEVKPLTDLVDQHIPTKKKIKFELFHPKLALQNAISVIQHSDIRWSNKLWIVPFLGLKTLLPVEWEIEEGFNIKKFKESNRVVPRDKIDDHEYLAYVHSFEYCSNEKIPSILDIDVFNVGEFRKWEAEGRPEKREIRLSGEDTVYHVSYGISEYYYNRGEKYVRFADWPFFIVKVDPARGGFFFEVSNSVVKDLEKIASLPIGKMDKKKAYAEAKVAN